MSRVLIVEDSPTQAQQIQIMLEESGFQVDVAGEGEQAMQAIRRNLPDIVATDLEMPRMNGLQLVEAIRHDFPALPVILMTAHGSEEIAALALRKGAASYVPKVHLEDDLVPSLERILEISKADRHQQRALECLTETQSRFSLHNDASLIPPIVGYLEGVLQRLSFCDATERMRVGVALQEALLNGMYHGNLEVSSDLRQGDERAYVELLEQRRQSSPFRSRRVELSAKVAPTQATFVVRDEGPGFDPSVLPDPTDPANLERIGGRGLLLIRTFMDQVFHNPQGNEITLTKRRQ